MKLAHLLFGVLFVLATLNVAPIVSAQDASADDEDVQVFEGENEGANSEQAQTR